MLTLLSLVSSVSPTLTSSTFSFYPFFLSACASSVYSSMHTVHCHSNKFLISGSSLEFVSPMCMACPYYYHTPSITYCINIGFNKSMQAYIASTERIDIEPHVSCPGQIDAFHRVYITLYTVHIRHHNHSEIPRMFCSDRSNITYKLLSHIQHPVTYPYKPQIIG
eukprot:41174_1